MNGIDFHQLLAIPEFSFVLGAITTALTSFIVTRYRWTAGAIGPVTKRLLQHMGWKGVAMSMGLSLVPDLLHAPIGAVQGLQRKEQKPAEDAQRRRGRSRKSVDLADPPLILRPKTIREAMLNAVLKNQIGSYGLSNSPDDGLRARVELILDKEDTPWLS